MLQSKWRTTLKKVSLPATVIVLLIIIAVTSALTLNNVTPNWSNPVGSSGPVTCQTFQTNGNETQIRFGDDDANSDDCPSDPNTQSGLGYEGTSTTATFDSGVPFIVGEITHYNNSVIASSLLQSVDLDLAIDFGDPAYTDTFSTTVTIDETANLLNTCPYGDTQPCADQITLNRTSSTFMVGADEYQFEILGMIPGSLGSCNYDESQISTSFISDEAAANSACVFGRLTLLEDAAVELTKGTDPSGITTVAPGDILDFRIDYECTTIVSSCLNVEILDTLPDEFIFVGSTGSIHFNTGVYSEDNNSVRWDLRSNQSGILAAGSTGFVRVRVQVRDDGTIPNNQPIENIVISTLDNGPTYQTGHTVTNSATSNWIVNKIDPVNVYLDTNRPTTDASYTVQICSNGSTVNLLNAQMVDTLPDGFEFTGASGGGVYDAGPPQTVTWELGDLSADSGCTSRTIEGRFPSPPFSDGEQVTNSVTGTGTPVGEQDWTDTDSVTNTLETLIPNPSATLSKAAVRNDYPIGAEAQFRLSPANTGNITLLNFVVTDTVPPQMDVTRITVGSYSNFGSQQVTIRYQTNFSGGFVDWPGGPFDDNNQQLNTSSLGLGASEYITGIQWDYGSVLPGFSTSAPARLYGTVINPDNNGDPVTAGQNITNEAVLTYEFPDGSGGTGSGSSFDGASLTVTTAPNPAFSKNSAGGVSSQWRFLIGQQVGYYQLNPNNNTGIALDNLSIEDTVPAQFNVTSVTSGSYSNGGGVTTTVSYQTNQSGGFTVLGSSPGTTNATFAIPALAAGEYVTHVRWEYGTVPAEFSASTRPRISGAVINPDNNGSAVNDGDSMTNNAVMAWEFEGIPESRSDSSTDTVREPVAQPSLSKSTLTSGPYIPTSVVTYSLRVGAAGSSPSVMPNPIVMDLLPEGMIYMPGTWAFNPGSTGAPAPAFEVIEDYNGTGRTLLRWTFNHTFTQGQNATITFDAGLSAGVSQGSMENTYYVTSDDIPLQSGDPDSGDLDGDGNSGDLIAGTSTSILIDELVGLNSVKGVMGELDSEFSVYPETGRTLPNGDITYRLSIINQGNIPINNVKVIDILPFVGDTGVRDLSQRDTEWRPFLTGLVASPPGVTVYYSTSMNPCRPDIVPSGPATCTPPNWSTLPPADITTVQSLRFDFAGVLEPGESFNFTWNMQAPASAPEGAIAWNSFAFTSTNADTGIPLRPAEPNKVGIEIETPEIAPLIQLEKATNGEDADLPTGPLVPLGDPVTWTYVITNTGNTRLADVTLTDDQLGAIVCNEADPIPNLDPGESFTCTAPAGVSVAGQYTNTGTVEGTPVNDSGLPLIDPDTGNPVPPVEDSDPSHYYGYNPNLARLGDFVWIDMNGDGVQDAGEAGLPGITVNLYDGTDTLIDTTTTDGNGLYNFVDIDVSVTGNDYIVEFVLPGVYSFTAQNQGGDTEDSDADPTTGRTITITLNAGDDDRTWDAGVVPPASIGDYVWIDSDGDGVQEAGEPGLSNVPVRLYRDEIIPMLIGTTSTDPDGAYSFIDLEPGDYYVEFDLPDGYIFTRFNSGGDDTLDSDANRSTGQTTTTTLDAGMNDPTWDAGVVSPAAVGNFVWADTNANGVQDAGEPGVENVTVTLYDSSNSSVATTTTDANGAYLFDNLLPGDYSVGFSNLPTGFEFSPQNAGSDDALNSDPDTTSGRTSAITLVSGQNDMTWDAGIFQRASIGDTVWEDTNANGVQDAGEPGVQNVTVTLYNSGGSSIATTTDANGEYLFDNLIPGVYSVGFTLPTGFEFSPQGQGTPATDSDADTTTGQTVAITLVSGQNDMTWDAGIFQRASIGDTVWEDTNANGVQDDGEPGVQNVTVTLYDSGGSSIATTTTDANGEYLFVNLLPGVYSVGFTLPTGFEFSPQGQGTPATDSDPDTTSGRAADTTLVSGENDLTWDAGIFQRVSLGDFVWTDSNRNGIQDTNEPGVENITVELFDSDENLLETTTTDVDGFYQFDDLVPGDYYLVFSDIPSGYVFSTQNRGSDIALDSDADNRGQTLTITLQSGQHDMTWDAGIHVPPPPSRNFIPEPTPEIFSGLPEVTSPVTPARTCQQLCTSWQLYHTNQTGDWEIFRLGDLDGKPSISANLSQGINADDMAPSRSPNAGWIVFTSNRDGNWEIYVAPADGDSSQIRRVTHNEIAIDTDPVWGPNNYVVFETTRNGNWDLYQIDMATGRLRQLTFDEGNDLNAFWSPDGSKIVFQSDRSGQWQIYELDLATLSTTLLSDGTGIDVDPQYSNGGDRIAFRSYRDGGESVLYIMDAAGTNLVPVSDLSGDATNHSWSPDDTLIAYQSDLDGDLDVYVYEVGSGATRQLTDNDIPDYAPSWQCSSTRVLFTSDINGNPDIFDADALPISQPGIEVDEEAIQLTVVEHDDVYPLGAPLEENASREGQLPQLGLGEQTTYLRPEASTTILDLSREESTTDWNTINGCPAP